MLYLINQGNLQLQSISLGGNYLSLNIDLLNSLGLINPHIMVKKSLILSIAMLKNTSENWCA